MPDHLRDAMTDASRDGSGQQQKKNHSFEVPMHPTTLLEEKLSGGWLRTTRPEPVMPGERTTQGTRGQGG